MSTLSPTMAQSNFGTWQKVIGNQLSPGEMVVEIESGKVQVDF